jgi:glycolate oxidase
VFEFGGKTVKNSSGYSLKDLFIGSEGTLGIIVKIYLKLLPQPRESVSLLMPFSDVESCISAVPKVLRFEKIPTAIEFMEKDVITTAEKFKGSKFPHNTAKAYLLLMIDGDSEDELEKTYMDIAEICLENGAEDVLIADTEKNKEAIWGLRDVFLEAIKNSTTDMDECDVVVPVTKLAAFIDSVKGIKDKYDLRVMTFGHAGDGNVHVYICRDETPEGSWKEKLAGLMKDMYDVAKDLEGQVSGEHGIGHAKKEYLKASIGEDALGLMRGIKSLFDPLNILNPGKVV